MGANGAAHGGLCSAWGSEGARCRGLDRSGIACLPGPRAASPHPAPCSLPSLQQHPGVWGLSWLCCCQFPPSAAAPALCSGLRWCLFNHLSDKPGQTMKCPHEPRNHHPSALLPIACCPPAFPRWYWQRNAQCCECPRGEQPWHGRNLSPHQLSPAPHHLHIPLLRAGCSLQTNPPFPACPEHFSPQENLFFFPRYSPGKTL